MSLRHVLDTALSFRWRRVLCDAYMLYVMSAPMHDATHLPRSMTGRGKPLTRTRTERWWRAACRRETPLLTPLVFELSGESDQETPLQ